MRNASTLFAALAAAALLATPGARAAQQQFPTPNFSTDEAAYCTATFGWLLRFIAPEGMSQEEIAQTNIAFMMWNYELNISAPTADDATMQAAADAAIAKISAKFPEGDSPEVARQIVEMMAGEAAACGDKLAGAYPSGDHPVIAELKKQAAAQAQKQQAAPAESPQ